jgi:hypothetical protein
MSVPWHQRSPNEERSLRSELEKKFPDLNLTIEGSKGLLRGTFPVISDGVELDRYLVEIHIPADFPQDIPVVYVKGHRVPHDVDWHTFKAGNLCVIVPEEWFLNPNAESLIAYLDGPLRNFFIGHSLAELGQPRPMGERSHNAQGLLESYGEIVGSTEPKTIIRYLDYCGAKKLKLHWPCPCGSGKRVSVCHLKHMVDLRKRVPRWIAQKAFQRLLDIVKSIQKNATPASPHTPK